MVYGKQVAYGKPEIKFIDGNLILGRFDPVHSESTSLTFVNGIATGLVTYSNPKKMSIVLNKNGFIVGNYIFPDGYTNKEMTFNKNGVVIKYVERDPSGRVQNKIDIGPELLQTGEKYLAGTISRQQLDDMKIKADTVSITNSYLKYATIFEEECHILPSFGGDDSYYDNGYKTIFNRVYGRYIFFESLK